MRKKIRARKIDLFAPSKSAKTLTEADIRRAIRALERATWSCDSCHEDIPSHEWPQLLALPEGYFARICAKCVKNLII